MKDHYVFLVVLALGLLLAYWSYRQHQAQAATAKNLQDMTAMMDRMITILPQIMRGQHVMELAYGKQCPWMTGAIPPGANPFAAPSSPQGANPSGQIPGR